MAERMSHRGPDADGVYQHKNCTLGHRRLSIIDLDSRSNQPFTDVSGRYTVVFNGQIYNFKEIKAMLPEYPFRTTSDTEVIVAAYAKWGLQCVERMHGMFAFAIYDAVEESLFLARDRFGVKPLYYALYQDVFLFASEVRALLSTGLVSKKLDHQGVHELLMFQSAACPNSIVEGVKQLHPAHYAVLKNGRLEEKRYWMFGASANGVATNYTHACKEVRRLFFESVERRMISDVPLGAFLSGGIDSSAIVAAMSQIRAPVNTFSIVFSEPEYDESEYSDLMAQKYATRHHRLLLSPGEFLSELPNALDAMDSPSADGMNTYIVSKLTRKAGVTVALSGLGGDELFAGYPNFRVWHKLHRTGFFILPRVMRRLIASKMQQRGNIRWGHFQGLSCLPGGHE
jgi:asparagine synthase (glutamine-hydrolysing)